MMRSRQSQQSSHSRATSWRESPAGWQQASPTCWSARTTPCRRLWSLPQCSILRNLRCKQEHQAHLLHRESVQTRLQLLRDPSHHRGWPKSRAIEQKVNSNSQHFVRASQLSNPRLQIDDNKRHRFPGQHRLQHKPWTSWVLPSGISEPILTDAG